MIIKRLSYINKSSWGFGPWMTEPDELMWIDKNTGFTCIIMRSSLSGTLNGYVEVDYLHPFYKQKLDFECHFGITYTGFRSDKPFRNKWLFGFDCNHFSDFSPISNFNKCDKSDYRDIEYVEQICEKLAKQMKITYAIDKTNYDASKIITYLNSNNLKYWQTPDYICVYTHLNINFIRVNFGAFKILNKRYEKI